MVLYASERALSEIDDSRVTEQSSSVGASKNVTGQASRTVDPGFRRNVARALRTARWFRGRRVVHDLSRVEHGHQIVDVRLGGLNVGVMPFLGFADAGRGRGPRVGAFWAHAGSTRGQGRRRAGEAGDMQMVLVGSLENVITRRWEPVVPDVVSHEYPSDPGFLSECIAAEYGLVSVAVREEVEHHLRIGSNDPGARATFAWRQTERASRAVDGEGVHRTWVRDSLPRARVVAITVDVDLPGRVLVARPVLVEDLT